MSEYSYATFGEAANARRDLARQRARFLKRILDARTELKKPANRRHIENRARTEGRARLFQVRGRAGVARVCPQGFRVQLQRKVSSGQGPGIHCAQRAQGDGGMRRAARKDRNQAQIEAVARRMGARVADTSQLGDGFPDLVLGVGSRNELIEIKHGRSMLTPAEARFHAYWQTARVIRSVDEMVGLINSLRAGR